LKAALIAEQTAYLEAVGFVMQPNAGTRNALQTWLQTFN
jgi:hypothetical protein